MSNFICSFALMILLFSQACSSHADTAFICPLQLSVVNQVVNPPKGWDVPSVGKNGMSNHHLVSSTFTDGPPEERAFLRPSKTIKDSGSRVNAVKYDFSDSTGKGIWQVCMYGNTPAIVSRKLPENVVSCKVTLPADLSKQEVNCQ